MPKPVTIWKTRSGSDTVTAHNADSSLLLETGFVLLLETNFDFLLEDSVVTPKSRTDWDSVSKVRTSWQMRDGYSSVSVGLGDTRFTEQSDTRITEQGDTRITEPATFTDKPRTEWSEE